VLLLIIALLEVVEIILLQDILQLLLEETSIEFAQKRVRLVAVIIIQRVGYTAQLEEAVAIALMGVFQEFSGVAATVFVHKPITPLSRERASLLYRAVRPT
jgi:uncharacterized membrane protein YfbV (UPF0208 family)